jgi:hypothetical protein
MPNWCNNTLKVIGPEDELQKLREKMKGRDIDWGNPSDFEKDVKLDELEFDFNQFVPVPEEVREKGFNHAGHDWCVSNWGTKWPCDAHSFYHQGELLIVDFDTAWSPPTPVIKAMGKMFPKLTFQLDYKEEGMQFMGTFIVAKGRVTLNSYLEGDDFVSDEEEDEDEDA